MYIGQIAQRAGVSVKTVRYYESLGLLPTVRRRGNYRVFTEQDIRAIDFIKRAQSLGFSLSELKPTLHIRQPERLWPAALQLLHSKAEQLEEQITTLQRQQADTRAQAGLIEDCLKKDPHCKRPLFEDH